MGIAMIATMLTMNSKQNYLDLAGHISLLDFNTMNAYMQSAGATAFKFARDIGGASGAEFAIRNIVMRVNNQAFMMSFIQLTWITMFVFGLSFIPLYFLKLGKKGPPVLDAH